MYNKKENNKNKIIKIIIIKMIMKIIVNGI